MFSVGGRLVCDLNYLTRFDQVLNPDFHCHFSKWTVTQSWPLANGTTGWPFCTSQMHLLAEVGAQTPLLWFVVDSLCNLLYSMLYNRCTVNQSEWSSGLTYLTILIFGCGLGSFWPSHVGGLAAREKDHPRERGGEILIVVNCGLSVTWWGHAGLAWAGLSNGYSRGHHRQLASL